MLELNCKLIIKVGKMSGNKKFTCILLNKILSISVILFITNSAVADANNF